MDFDINIAKSHFTPLSSTCQTLGTKFFRFFMEFLAAGFIFMSFYENVKSPQLIIFFEILKFFMIFLCLVCFWTENWLFMSRSKKSVINFFFAIWRPLDAIFVMAILSVVIFLLIMMIGLHVTIFVCKTRFVHGQKTDVQTEMWPIWEIDILNTFPIETSIASKFTTIGK